MQECRKRKKGQKIDYDSIMEQLKLDKFSSIKDKSPGSPQYISKNKCTESDSEKFQIYSFDRHFHQQHADEKKQHGSESVEQIRHILQNIMIEIPSSGFQSTHLKQNDQNYQKDDKQERNQKFGSIIFDDYSKQSCFNSVYQHDTQQFKFYVHQPPTTAKNNHNNANPIKIVKKFYKPFDSETHKEKENIRPIYTPNNMTMRYLAPTQTSQKKVRTSKHTKTSLMTNKASSSCARNLFSSNSGPTGPKISKISKKVYGNGNILQR